MGRVITFGGDGGVKKWNDYGTSYTNWINMEGVIVTIIRHIISDLNGSVYRMMSRLYDITKIAFGNHHFNQRSRTRILANHFHFLTLMDLPIDGHSL